MHDDEDMPWRVSPSGGAEWYDGEDAADASGSSGDGYRWRQLGLRGGVALAVVVMLAAVVGLQSSDARRARRVPWCRDAASQVSEDGYGWENGRLCRVTAGSTPSTATTSAAAPAAADPAPATPAASPPTTSVAADTTAAPAAAPAADAPVAKAGSYQANLNLVKAQPWRNKNEDGSADRNTPSSKLVLEQHYGPRSEYLNYPGGNPENDFPVDEGGQFREGCEFSHFAYDDPIVFPGQPGASHLHIFFGNTDANAYSTADSILNSGGSTCNGGELNRTSYWAPAMFDGSGNVRVPERLIVYYKGEGLANGKAEVFPAGAAMIAKTDLNTIDNGRGGAAGKFSFMCTDNYRGGREPAENTMVTCDGNAYGGSDPHTVLEMDVKFPQCWNGKDPGNPANYAPPTDGGWYFSNCTGEFNHTFTNMEYLIAYPVAPGETTAGWYLSSDVDAASRKLKTTPGASNHADWFDGWNTKVNKLWIDNCVNFRTSEPSGCGFGYLSNGGPNGDNPLPGPALKYRKQYTGQMKVPAADVYKALCPGGGNPASAMTAAYCQPAAMPMKMSAVKGDELPVFCQLKPGLLATTRRDGASGSSLT